jgi:hypothetical protein
MNHVGTKWLCMNLVGTIWLCMNLVGTIWLCMDLFVLVDVWNGEWYGCVVLLDVLI